jgi:hypothetical protein
MIEPAKTKKKTIAREEPEKGPIVKWIHRGA